MGYNTPQISKSSYLTIAPIEDGLTVSFSNPCYYCINGDGAWVQLSSGTQTPAISSGDKISFKSTTLKPNSSSGIGTFTTNKRFNLEGNIMSMLFGDDAITSISLEGYPYAFKFLFRSSKVVRVSKDFLPATTLSVDCYRGLFYECPYLVNSPDLPAMRMKDSCYRGMFYSCPSLVEVCELPAMELAENCYWSMYQFCTALISVQEQLPAMELKTSCYSSMYNGCSILREGPKLPALKLVSSCYTYLYKNCYRINRIHAMFLTSPSSTYTKEWVINVPSSGTFIKNVDASWNNIFGTSYIPNGWDVIYE